MKKILSIHLLIAFAVVFASCGTNNSVVSNSLISKRKHTKGFHFNKKGNVKPSKSQKEEESIAFDDSKNNSVIEAKGNEQKPKQPILKKNTEGQKEPAAWMALQKEEEKAIRNEVISEDTEPAAFEDVQNESTTEKSTFADKQAVAHSIRKEAKNTLKSESKKGVNGSNDDAMFVLIVILTILIPPLGVAIYTNIDWMKVLIALVLTLLFYLPGLIYGLLVVFDVI